MRKKSAILLLILAALALAGCAAHTDETALETAAPAMAEAVVIEAEPEPTEEPTLFLIDDAAHPALLALKSDGKFHPASPVTRGELCAMLYPMFEGLAARGTPFSDVRHGDEAYTPVTALYRAGLLPDAAGGAYYPDRVATRAYLCSLLHNIAEALGGEDAARVRLLAIDVSAGLTAAEGADLSVGAWFTRAEAAVIAERLLGREPDASNLFMNGCIPRDMIDVDEGWEYIADAVTEGPVVPVSGGVHRLYGWLYAAWDDGTMITDMDYGVWTFGADGRYTTGSAELDGYLLEALELSGANGLDDEAALQAAYLYIKYNFEYIVRPEDMETIPVGVTGWEYERATRFFRYGGGTCYGYAAAFGLMARALGEHAYVVAAEINQFYGAHGFVVIPEGDEDIIYDVEMEATRPERHRDLELFGIRNYAIYNYWYVANWREA